MKDVNHIPSNEGISPYGVFRLQGTSRALAFGYNARGGCLKATHSGVVQPETFWLHLHLYLPCNHKRDIQMFSLTPLSELLVTLSTGFTGEWLLGLEYITPGIFCGLGGQDPKVGPVTTHNSGCFRSSVFLGHPRHCNCVGDDSFAYFGYEMCSFGVGLSYMLDRHMIMCTLVSTNIHKQTTRGPNIHEKMGCLDYKHQRRVRTSGTIDQLLKPDGHLERHLLFQLFLGLRVLLGELINFFLKFRKFIITCMHTQIRHTVRTVGRLLCNRCKRHVFTMTGVHISIKCIVSIHYLPTY